MLDYTKYAFEDAVELLDNYPASQLAVMAAVAKADVRQVGEPGFKPRERPSYNRDAIKKLTAQEFAKIAREQGLDPLGRLAETEAAKEEAGDPTAKTMKSSIVSGKILVPAFFATVMHEVCTKGREVRFMVRASNNLNLDVRMKADDLFKMFEISPEDLKEKAREIFNIKLKKDPDEFTHQMLAFYVNLFDRLSKDPLLGGLGLPGKDPGPPRKMEIFAFFQPMKLHS